jgi:hypothetical protein
MKLIENRAWSGLPAVPILALALALAGCGTPGAPLPPSLKLPVPVTDLSAVRAGNQISLTWSMPKKTTDKLLLKGNVSVRVCRQELTGPCVPAATLMLAPDSDGVFSETLPAALLSGEPRALTYFVELANARGRSAGLSNPAVAVAGAPPPAVAGLAARVRKDGIVLRWAPDAPGFAVRLHRKLIAPASEPKAKTQTGLLAPAPEPAEQDLVVEPSSKAAPDHALDKTVRFGQVYEYRAQRVARLAFDGQAVELTSEISAPVRVEVLDVFPPAVPTGLAAVATLGENGAETAIDLSWQPVTDADLAGYAVYRHQPDGSWQRISPPQPLVGPAFHDTGVRPGQSYRYAVTAIDQGGHESARSAEAEETVPNP